MLLAEIKDFNALIDNKPHFEKPTKNKQEANEKLVEISRNNDYTPGNVDYWYCQKYYKIISIFYHDKRIRIFLDKLISCEN